MLSHCDRAIRVESPGGVIYDVKNFSPRRRSDRGASLFLDR